MVHFVDAAGNQRLQMFIFENPERNRNLQRQFAFDAPDCFGHTCQQRGRGTAHRDDDAELAGAAFVRGPRGVDERLDALQRLGSDVARVPRALRAEVAIFGTASALGVEEHFDGGRIADVSGPDVVGER